jgi:hypothetical protein
LAELRDVLDTLASDMEQDRPAEADQEDNGLIPNGSTDNISIASASPVTPASATPPKAARTKYFARIAAKSPKGHHPVNADVAPAVVARKSE